ncbi:Mu transposase C-terminal domain-containing protein [Streptomyces mirabilis]|uniref:Mu transposase C-terminal domain-containing protein n=2 Tax=Streptomyces mirabilis TaxID=68239 RepID=UPI0036BA3470
MPREWRVIGRSGVRINNRTYDAPGLAPFRRQPSGAGPDGKLWEVHYDPYDISCVWVRNHHGTGWITATWRHLRTSTVPMGEMVFDRAHQILTERGQRKPDEDAVAQVVAELLDRASDGPDHEPGFDLADLPEIVAAQQRHYRLLRRHGPHVLNPCYAQCSLFWHVLMQHGYKISERPQRLVRLQPRPARSVRPWDPKRYAAVYPEIVTTMALYASPHWRRLAMSSNEEDFWAFHTEFTRRLPNENPLRRAARPWFIHQLRVIAHTIQNAAEHPTEGNTERHSPGRGESR